MVNNFPKSYACVNKKNKILKDSSSGGVFYALASQIIESYKGVIYGCICNWDKVYHDRAENMDELLPMMGSKYIRSDLNNTFKRCKEDLDRGRYVLFCGTPCQINALHFYLDRFSVDKKKLISVDLICHGTPKSTYWKEYLRLNFGDKKDNINFRYKKNGWENFYIKIGDYEAPFNEDPFMKAFLGNQILHESCYNCKIKGENRKADITLGDFWGLDKIDNKLKNKLGTSLIIVRNKQSFLLRMIRKQCICRETPYLSSLFSYNKYYFKSVEKPSPCSFQTDFLRIKNTDKTINKIHTLNANYYKRFKHFIIKSLDSHKNGIHVNKFKRKRTGKIGIITDKGYFNYGNRLQNYSLISILRKSGKKPVNIIFSKTDYKVFHYFYNFLHNYKDKPLYEKKEPIYKASLKYEGKPFVYSKTKRKEKSLCKFDSVIVGSDQVWNFGYHKYDNDLEYSLGNFGIINPPFKLFSYAASICQNHFDPSNEFLFKSSLSNFSMISVRENQSKDLLRQVGYESIKVVDPTFLLTKSEWEYSIRKYSKKPLPEGKFQVNYIFEDTCDFKCDDDVLIVNDLFTGDYNQFDFINYIKHATCVVTNSFHALVFCVIFGKKVYLLKRKFIGMESRILELLNLIGIYDHSSNFYDLSKIDKTNLDNIISLSFDYLKNNI